MWLDMKKEFLKVLFIEIFYFSFILLYVLFFNIKFGYLPIILINIILSIVLIYFFKYKGSKRIVKKKIFIDVLIYSILFFVLSYILSIPFGYVRSIYVLNIVGIFKNVVPILFLIVSSEVFRSLILSKNNKVHMILITLIMTFIDIVFNIGLLKINYESIVMFICAFVIPSLSKNIFLTYLSYNVGFSSPIVYRLIFEVSDYLMPIFPGFTEYLQCIIDTLIPLIILIRIRFLLTCEEYVFKNNILINSFVFMIGLIMFIIVILFSGVFKYFVIAVNSDSMKNTFNKGDIIIVEKINDFSKVEVGDVLVFDYDNAYVSHRVFNIIKSGNDYYFETKGDNNSDKDNFIVGVNKVKGKVLYNVPYLGWPSVFFNDLGKE